MSDEHHGLRGPVNPHEWLRRARSNMARAKADRAIPEVVLEDLCFDAQQAAEKAIKAILVAVQRSFPKTHSIGELLDLVEASGVRVPVELGDARALTEYAVAARYPGFGRGCDRGRVPQSSKTGGCRASLGAGRDQDDTAW
jgi:HEPN domain-containing protein